jgi:membrane protein YqaA with SNARE-associated domain
LIVQSPIHHVISQWSRFAQLLISWGPPGLFVLSILDSAGLPVVGGVDALLVAISTHDPHEAYLAAALAVAGSVAGSLVLYVIARAGGEVVLTKHVSSRRGRRLHRWFQRYGLVTVFIPAISPLPLPMKVPVFCAGALQVRVGYFIVVILVARGIRYFALAYLGQRYGHSTFHFLVSHGVMVAVIAIALAAVAVVGLRVYQRHEIAEGKPE